MILVFFNVEKLLFTLDVEISIIEEFQSIIVKCLILRHFSYK